MFVLHFREDAGSLGELLSTKSLLFGVEFNYAIALRCFTPMHKVNYPSTFVLSRISGSCTQPVDASTQCNSDELDF